MIPKAIMYNNKSLLKESEFTLISLPLKTTNPNTKEVINIPLPIILPKEKEILSFSEATNDDIISGAQFPKEINVTAAMFWFILYVSINFTIAVLKKRSLVDERIKKRIIRKIKNTIMDGNIDEFNKQ